MTGRPKRRRLVLAVLLAGGVLLGWAVAHRDVESAMGRSGTPGRQEARQPVAASRRVTFLELGGVGCRPCEAMKPVLQAVRERYPGRVDVAFVDVRQDPAAAGEYRIRLIPTQVFLLPDGAEFFRHEGYFPLDEVEKVLGRMGVARDR